MNQSERYSSLTNEEKVTIILDDLRRRGYSGARAIEELNRIALSQITPADGSDDDVNSVGYSLYEVR